MKASGTRYEYIGCPDVTDHVPSVDPVHSWSRAMDRLRRWSRALSTFSLALATAFALPDGGRAQDTDVAATVRAREMAFAQSMADRDFEAFLTFVSTEAIFFNGDQPLRGRDAVARAWRPFFEGPDAPFSWQPSVVEVLESGRLAISSGPVYNPAGEEAGRFNSIWRLEADGQWMVIFDKGS